ncbi:MAG: tetratricopeptide repeat protein [Kiritimatiellae bacterium]|nr:tetratricopeptide repeat protein [Kiritimatiellia bacterium]
MPTIPESGVAASQAEASGAGPEVDGAVSFTGDDPPPPPPVARRADWIIAGIFSFVFLLVYLGTSSSWAFPGASADLMCQILGAVPPAFPANQALIAFHRFFAMFGGARGATFAATLVSALTLGATYLFVKALFGFLMDRTYVEDSVANGRWHADNAPRIGAAAATLALALCPPYWLASTRVNAWTFGLFFLVLSAWLLVRFLAEDRLGPLWVFAAVYGALCTQYLAAIQFFPAFLAAFAFGALATDRNKWLVVAVPAAIFAAAVGFCSWLCVEAYSGGPGYELMEYKGKVWVVANFMKPLLVGAAQQMVQVHWLILGGMTVLPFFAWVLVGRFCLAGPDLRPPMWIMNAAILVSALLVLFGSRYSPWGLFGFRAEQVLVHVLAASSFAYCVLAAWLQLLFAMGSRRDPPQPAAVHQAGFALRVLVLALAAAAVVHVGRFGRTEADSSATQFLRTYVDEVLDGMAGRDMLVTDSLFGAMYRLRSRERGLSFEIFDIFDAEGTPERRLFRRSVKNAALRNALDIGPFQFLQEFIGHDQTAGEHVALTWFPDLWNLGDWRVFPRGLLFLGAPGSAPVSNPLGESSADPLGDDLAKFRGIEARLLPELDTAGLSGNKETVLLAKAVRRRLSFVGNDLAYYLETADRKEDALALYREVHAFDPENMSCTLNLFTACGAAGLKEEQAAVRAELEAFRAKTRRPLQIWELSRSQGYVSAPEAFATLGWSWAMTGQTALAMGTLGSALRDADSGQRAPLLRVMASIHARRGDTERSEEFWMQALEADPNDRSALFGLLAARLSRGETGGCRELIDRLAESGMDPARLLVPRIQLLTAEGDEAGARTIAEMRLRETPNDPDALFALFTADMAAYGTAPSDMRPEILARLEDWAARLRDNPASRTLQGAVATGELRTSQRDWAGARDEFEIANKSSPNQRDIVDRLLHLDYLLLDTAKARLHATDLLEIDPDHGFANYVLGSLALSAGNFDSAIAFLERSASNWDSPLPLGDLAWARHRVGDEHGAIRLADEALAMKPDLYQVIDTRGLALLALGRNDEAVEEFEKAIAINPDHPVVHLHLARARLAVGQREAALETLSAAEDLETKFRGADLDFYNELRSELRGSAPQ